MADSPSEEAFIDVVGQKNKQSCLVLETVQESAGEHFGPAEIIQVGNYSIVYPAAKPPHLGDENFRNLKERLFGRRIKIFNGRGEQVEPDSLKTFSLTDGDVETSILNNGGDIIFFDRKQDSFVALETQDDKGHALPPDQWKIFDKTSVDKLSTESKTTIKLYSNPEWKGLKCFRQINNDWYLVLFDDCFKFYKPGNPPVVKEIKMPHGNTCCADPKNPEVFYTCLQRHPEQISIINTSTDKPDEKFRYQCGLPYEKANNLQCDPEGKYFLVSVEQDGKRSVVLIDKKSGKQLFVIPGFSHANFDTDGRIRAFNEKEKRLIYFQPRQINPQMSTVEVSDFQMKVVAKWATGREIKITLAKDFGTIRKLKEDLEEYCEKLKICGYPDDAIQEVRAYASMQMQNRSKVLASKPIDQNIDEIRRLIKRWRYTPEKIAGMRGYFTDIERGITDAKKNHDGVKHSTDLQFKAIKDYIRKKFSRIYRVESPVAEKKFCGILEEVKESLEDVDSLVAFGKWLHEEHPKFLRRIESLEREFSFLSLAPSHYQERQKLFLHEAQGEFNKLASGYRDKFQKQAEEERRGRPERVERLKNALYEQIDGILKDLRGRMFRTRNDAEEYINKNKIISLVDTRLPELIKLGEQELAEEISHRFNIKLYNFRGEVERGEYRQIDETGKSMVLFGETPFLKWEGSVTKKMGPRVELKFITDEKQPPSPILARKGWSIGDAGAMIRMPSGDTRTARLFEGLSNEAEWRFGLYTWDDESLPAARMRIREYSRLKKHYQDWKRGDQSKIHRNMDRLSSLIHRFYDRFLRGHGKIQRKLLTIPYSLLVDFYRWYLRRNHVPLLHRMDTIQRHYEELQGNGKGGTVPEWKDHWVLDTQSEEYLEQMARTFLMQLDFQSDCLLLKGHAGTGKDVLINMFCERTRRPYFAFDCSKWTTEYELSEDIVLESKEGASQTLKVPSVVLNAITTPGAVMYFNEFNAMPEQSQIFLHALMDEKRTLSLKTSSGKPIKSHPSILLVASMNPNYPGTFTPQFATRSRMVTMEVKYPPSPPLKKEEGIRSEPRFDHAEALRMARSTKSLARLTYDTNPDRNEFIKVWDKLTNNVQSADCPSLTQEQQFDLMCILALVEFAAELRANFVINFEKRKGLALRSALPVKVPITLREMRRMAWELSYMPTEIKLKSNPDQIARQLIEQYFLSQIDTEEDKEKIKTAMTQWTSRKRVGNN